MIYKSYSGAFCILWFVIWTLTANCEKIPLHPDLDLTLEQRVKKHGYPIETHVVETKDNYILSLYHIPHGHKEEPNSNRNKSIVILIHGMGGSPYMMILGKGKAPAYYFADRGLDVWLFSSRGVQVSSGRQHETLDWEKDSKYWAYSLEEIGVYDVAAVIDYILDFTGQKKVSVIGHSSGGYESFILLSEKPEYNNKIKILINWGSVPLFKHMDYPIIRLFSELVDVFKTVYSLLRWHGMKPSMRSFLQEMVRTTCADTNTEQVCILGTGVAGGHRSYIDNPIDQKFLMSCIADVAAMQAFHFMSNIKSATFSRYDYGPKKNMRLYGQEYPPEYNLSAATIPVAFFSGHSDDICGLLDVYESAKAIPNPVLIHKIPFEMYNHIDYIFGHIYSTEMVYAPTYKLISDYDKGIVPPRVKVPDDYLSFR